MRKNYTWYTDLISIFILMMIFYLGLSFLRPLASPDEGRYTEIPREMLANNDWVSPTLNDMPYFYKPPMFYWMQALSLKTFGINRVSSRLPNALMAVLGICFTYACARILYDRKSAIFSAIVLSTSALYYALGQVVTLDMTVSVFIAGAMFSFIVAVKKSGIFRTYGILLFFTMMGLAVMTKGLIGILIPVAVATMYILATNPITFAKEFITKKNILLALIGMVIFAVISVPWHILASLANPAFPEAEGIFSKNMQGQGFFWYYIIHEHILRFVDAETSLREEPFWFFLVLAPAGLIPWLVFICSAWKEALSSGLKKLTSQYSTYLYFAFWAIFIIGFFSISKSKLVPYILPIYPAMAIPIGIYLAKVWSDKNFKFKLEGKILGVLTIIGVIALPIVYIVLDKKGKLFDPNELLLCIVPLAITLSINAIILFKTLDKPKKFIINTIVGVSILLLFLNPLARSLQRTSTQEIAEKLLKIRKADDIIMTAFGYSDMQDLPVWLNETVVIFGNVPMEQEFGYMRQTKENENRFIQSDQALKDKIKSTTGDIYMVIRTVDIEKFSKKQIPYEEVKTHHAMCLLKLKKDIN